MLSIGKVKKFIVAKKIVFLVMGIFLILFAVIDLVVFNSDPYKMARKYILEDEEINRAYGTVEKLRTSGKMSGTFTTANFCFYVKGSSGEGAVRISMLKLDHVWVVDSHRTANSC